MNSGLQQAHDLPLPPLVFLVAALLAAAALLAVSHLLRQATASPRLMDSTRGPPSDGALLIVEPRPHPLLKPVIDAFSARVPSTWVLYVVHGRGNGDYARRAAEQVAETRRVVYLQLDADNLSAAQYNALFKTPAFWDRVQAEHVLVFQTDAMPCAGALDMARYGQFGYVGCAYGNAVGPNTGWGTWGFYGSGGLSLRRKSFMQECLRRYPLGSGPEAEDVTFSACVDDLAATYPKPTAADVGGFCAQNSWGDTARAPNSWGAHQIGKQMEPHLRAPFLEHCPAAALI